MSLSNAAKTIQNDSTDLVAFYKLHKILRTENVIRSLLNPANEKTSLAQIRYTLTTQTA